MTSESDKWRLRYENSVVAAQERAKLAEQRCLELEKEKVALEQRHSRAIQELVCQIDQLKEAIEVNQELGKLLDQKNAALGALQNELNKALKESEPFGVER